MHATATNPPLPIHPFAHPFAHGATKSIDGRSIEPDQMMGDRSMIEPVVPQQPAPQQGPGRLSRFMSMVARRLTTILIMTLVVLIAATLALRFATPLYTVSAQIMVQRVAPGNAVQSPDDRMRAVRNEEELIVSTPVVAAALAAPGVHDISAIRGRPDALKLIRQQLQVDSGKGDDLVNISFDAADPHEGIRLVAAVVDSYVRFRSGFHGTSIDGSTATVMAEKQKAIQTAAQLQSELAKFATDHGLVHGNEQVDADDEMLRELGQRLAQARVETVSARADYDQMQNELANDPRLRDQLAHDKDNDSSLADGDEQAIAKQIVSLQLQLAGYGTKFMANYAPVQLIHRKIDDLKLTRDAIIQQHWEAAVREEAQLQESYRKQEAFTAASAADEQTFQQRTAEVAEAQKQVAMLDKQLKDLDSANKQISTMVTVIEPATASDRPTKPRTQLILMIAALTGLVMGFGIAAFRDRHVEMQPIGSLKMLGDGLPLLARLPAVPRRQLAMNSWRDRMVDSATEFAEACRTVHAALEAVASFSGGRTVLVTSTNAQEGKSTLASLLALTLAQTGKRVLLVDANLHAPMQGNIFGVEGNYGLGELLEDEIESSFVRHVHPGTDARMDILLSGSCNVAIPDLLNSQRFTNLMAAMAAEYDYVLLDSPAVSAGNDARIIASACDATILLASESSVNRKAAAKTRDSLTSVGGNVIGIVLNGGRPAVESQAAIVNVDVSRHVPITEAVREPVKEPMRVTTVRHTAPAKPVPPMQPVVAAQVRRVVEEEPAVEEPRIEDERYSWIWSYLLVGALLVGAWIGFRDIAGAAAMHGGMAKDLSTGRLVPADSIAPVRDESVAIMMAGVGLLVVTLLAGFHARPPRQEIALLALGATLAVTSFCTGAISPLWVEQQHDVMKRFMVASILLFTSLLFGWSLVRRTNPATPIVGERDSLADVAVAVFADASAMSALMIVLSHWQTKGECLAVTAFCSCLAAMLAYFISPLRSSFWFWLSPLIVAIFGYACMLASAHAMHVGMLQSLARPMPIAYASMGPIGAVLGFWIARAFRNMVWLPAVAVE
jgi:succinoglycan biosynthesis transport protein ExoP